MNGAMKFLRFLPAVLLVTTGGAFVLPVAAPGYALIGGSLDLAQRDVRVFNNFTGAYANENTAEHASFPGYSGAELAIWKATVEWGSVLHGDGQGDAHQPGGLGSGGANFDPTWQGNAASVGGINDNVHSEILGSSGGVLAYCETPISNGWRIRYYSSWPWDDGPDAPPFGRMDIQGVATHEYGHALGLGHSGSVGATMYPTISGTGVSQRSIESDDVAGVQAIYGAASTSKPRITQSSVDTLGGILTLDGVNFAASGNEVWFTYAGVSTPASDPIVRVIGVASTGGGTTISVAIPSAAGPGDVLVRIPGSGHSSLSNAWPLDPSNAGSAFGAPVVIGVSPPSVPSVVDGPNLITVSGSGFSTLIEARLNSAVLDPLLVNVLSDSALTISLPLQPSLGPVGIELTNSFGTSPATTVMVVAPDPPALALDGAFLFSATGLNTTIGAEPGTFYVLAGSLVLAPTIIPGVLAADIGGQFQSLVVLSSGVVGAPGSTTFSRGIAGLPFATPIYLQAATMDPATGMLPYVMSNVATGTYYY